MTEEKTKSFMADRRTLLAIGVLIVIVLGIGAYYYSMQSTTKQRLIVSTTTSLYETGFLDVLKVEFEKQNPSINVSFISQGTGLAIQTAKRGDADMILVHDPAAELQFLKDGFGVNRKVIAYNFFVIVGPKDDPAKAKGLAPLDAFKKVKEAGEKQLTVWVSRGDNSGTHTKEKNLWKAAGLNATLLRKEKWYLEAGAGMTQTLKMADEKNGYTITDLGTYLMNYNKQNVKLEVAVSAGKDTLNVYSVIANNPQKTEVSKSNFGASMKFMRFLVSDAGQDLFGSYGKKDYGQPLFAPYIKVLKTGSNATLVQWVQQYAYFDGTECPNNYRYQAGDFYQIIGMKLSAIVPLAGKPETQ